MGASNNARLHWIIHPRDRERKSQRLFSLPRLARARVFAFISLFLSYTAFSAYSLLLFLAHRGGDSCIPRLPVLFRLFFFCSFAHADRQSTKKRWMKKSRAPWPFVTCLVVAERETYREIIAFNSTDLIFSATLDTKHSSLGTRSRSSIRREWWKNCAKD